MGYGSKSLNDWRDDALRIANEHGFKDASAAEDFALIHSEVSEALEDLRYGAEPREVWYEEKVAAYARGGLGGLRLMADGKPAFVAVRHAAPHPKLADGSFDLENPHKPCGIPSEMADVIIRVLHFCGKHGIDIEQAVREKTDYNETRPFKHGKKL